MLENEGAALVVVATRALLLAEAAEEGAALPRVWIVAGRAFEYAFDQAVPLVEGEVGHGLGMTVYAHSRAAREANQVCCLDRVP